MFLLAQDVSTRSTPTRIQPTKPQVTDVRLPNHVIPHHYSLELKPDFYGPDPNLFQFTGKVEILINCSRSTQEIVLHIKGVVNINYYYSLI